MLEHSPRGIGRGQFAGGLDQRADAERVRDHQRTGPIERSDLQFDGNDKPVVAVSQREFDQQHARQIGRPGIHRAEIHLRVFKFPEPCRRHAAKADRSRNDRARDFRRSIVGRCSERHLSIRIEGVPVQMAVRIFLCRQHALAIAEPRRHRKGILHAFGQPRRIGCFRLAEERLEPLQPEPRGLLDFRQIGRSNLQRGRNDDCARACRTEGGIEPPAVGDARCHQIKEAEAVAIECGTLLGRQCRKRILANERVAVIARQRLRSSMRRNC